MATTFFSFQKTALSDYDKSITLTFISRDPIFTTYATGLLGIYSKFYDTYIMYTYIKYTCITYTHVQQVWTLGYAYIFPLLKWRRYRILKVLTTRGPNGPDIAHLGNLPQSGLNLYIGYWEIVIFMFCATFSIGRWRPSCSAKFQKQSKWLNAKIIVIQSWYNSIERFFSSFILCYFQ